MDLGWMRPRAERPGAALVGLVAAALTCGHAAAASLTPLARDHLGSATFEVVLAKLAATVISERCSVRSWAPLWRSSSMKSSRSVDGGHRVSVA